MRDPDDAPTAEPEEGAGADRRGDRHEHEDRGRMGVRRRLQRLLNQRELAEDTREVIGGVLEMSDRAKTEAVRLVAREVRNYLDELKLLDDMKELVTSHSLEVKMSLHLRPLSEEAMRAPAPEPEAEARQEPKHKAEPRHKAEPKPRPEPKPRADTPARPEPRVEARPHPPEPHTVEEDDEEEEEHEPA